MNEKVNGIVGPDNYAEVIKEIVPVLILNNLLFLWFCFRRIAVILFVHFDCPPFLFILFLYTLL